MFMFKKYNQILTINFTSLIIKFNKFTYIVEKFIDNEKKEFSKIIKEFWIEHQITDLLKISAILFLILWIFFLIYYDVSHSHVTYDNLAQIKGTVDELVYVNKAQEEIIEIQSEKLKQMSGTVRQVKPGQYAAALVVTLTTVAGVAYFAGFATMFIIAASAGKL